MSKKDKKLTPEQQAAKDKKEAEKKDRTEKANLKKQQQEQEETKRKETIFAQILKKQNIESNTIESVTKKNGLPVYSLLIEMSNSKIKYALLDIANLRLHIGVTDSRIAKTLVESNLGAIKIEHLDNNGNPIKDKTENFTISEAALSIEGSFGLEEEGEGKDLFMHAIVYSVLSQRDDIIDLDKDLHIDLAPITLEFRTNDYIERAFQKQRITTFNRIFTPTVRVSEKYLEAEGICEIASRLLISRDSTSLLYCLDIGHGTAIGRQFRVSKSGVANIDRTVIPRVGTSLIIKEIKAEALKLGYNLYTTNPRQEKDLRTALFDGTYIYKNSRYPEGINIRLPAMNGCIRWMGHREIVGLIQQVKFCVTSNIPVLASGGAFNMSVLREQLLLEISEPGIRTVEESKKKVFFLEEARMSGFYEILTKFLSRRGLTIRDLKTTIDQEIKSVIGKAKLLKDKKLETNSTDNVDNAS